MCNYVLRKRLQSAESSDVQARDRKQRARTEHKGHGQKAESTEMRPEREKEQLILNTRRLEGRLRQTTPTTLLYILLVVL